uniref:Uncharacterized protein n=1 Tax=Leersia perrieri TaxID=77586 RepID=A0A0D9V0L5_9ORYZ
MVSTLSCNSHSFQASKPWEVIDWDSLVPRPRSAPPFNGINYRINVASHTAPGHRALHRRVAIVTAALVQLSPRISCPSVLASWSAISADQLVAKLNDDYAADDPSGPCAVAVDADVSDPAQAAFGPELHVLVADMEPDQWDHVFAVNARGTFLCCREAAVDSLRPGHGTYVATKAAVEGMTKVLAKELAGTGITANSVAPGPVASPMFYAGKSDECIVAAVGECPMERIGEPIDVAPVVCFLSSDAAG